MWRLVLLFLAGAGFGYLGMLVDPDAAPYLVPARAPEAGPLAPGRRGGHGRRRVGGGAGEFSTFLFTHNIEVAFFAFALGITVGMGTAIMLFVNGLMLGALA